MTTSTEAIQPRHTACSNYHKDFLAKIIYTYRVIHILSEATFDINQLGLATPQNGAQAAKNNRAFLEQKLQ